MSRDQDYLALFTDENFIFNVSFGTTAKVGADDFRHSAYIHEDAAAPSATINRKIRKLIS